MRGAYLHSLAQSSRETVTIDEAVVAESVGKATQAIGAIRAGAYPAVSSKKACSACEKSVRAGLEEWQG